MKLLHCGRALLLAVSLCSQAGFAAAPVLATADVRAVGAAPGASFDGVVEAVRQATIAAQISGEIVAVNVKPGDAVRAGQVLLRIDSHVADQMAVASEEQVSAAKVSLEIAEKELNRQRQLFDRQLISRMAFERAEAEFRSSSAQARTRIAEASAARTRQGFFAIKAPYAGVIAQVPAVVGDMAMPGQQLLTLYDPAVLRVTTAIPQREVVGLTDKDRQSIKIELTGQSGESSWLTPVRVQVLPSVDPSTHTVELRLELASGESKAAPGVVPGLFTRVWLAAAANRDGSVDFRLYVPARSVVQRAEMTGLYVVDRAGVAQLRQVRPGRRLNGEIEILSGVSAGEKVALDPDAAARQPR